MLNVVRYIKENGLESLEKDFGIVITRYWDRIVLNYSQIDSPKFHPICDECRGLILSWPELDVLCWPFHRFYNLTEGGYFTDDEFSIERMVSFAKIDGSLLNIYHDEDQWCCATRKRAFAEGQTNKGRTFEEVVNDAFPGWKNKMENLFKDRTYIFEIVSPETRIVVPYSNYRIYLLAVRDHRTGRFYSPDEVENVADLLDANRIDVETPKRYYFNNLNEVLENSKQLEPMDENGEGYVCFDPVTDNRLKIKNPAYLSLAHLRENGAISTKRIAKLVFDQDYEEYLTLFPEDKQFFDPYIEAFNRMMEDIKETWEKNKNIDSQKEFALNVKDLKIGSIMFQLRKGKKINEIFDDMQDKKKVELLESYKTKE